MSYVIFNSRVGTADGALLLHVNKYLFRQWGIWSWMWYDDNKPCLKRTQNATTSIM
jgi:hypothetical protein